MTKQEIVEQVADWAGGLHIAAEHMKPEAFKDDVLKTVADMIAMVQTESASRIWVSGMGLPFGL